MPTIAKTTLKNPDFIMFGTRARLMVARYRRFDMRDTVTPARDIASRLIDLGAIESRSELLSDNAQER